MCLGSPARDIEIHNYWSKIYGSMPYRMHQLKGLSNRRRRDNINKSTKRVELAVTEVMLSNRVLTITDCFHGQATHFSPILRNEHLICCFLRLRGIPA